MDIGASAFSLNAAENAKAIEAERKRDEKFRELITSCTSLSNYEGKRFKTLLPQIMAASLAAMYHIAVGLSLAYSAILLPQLENKNSTDFNITRDEGAWIASIIVIAVPIGSPVGGVLMDWIGRLNTVKLAAIPGVLGWCMIALAPNLPTLLVGRVFTGFASALGSGPAVVYLTEVARADMRGSLISLAPAYTSLGMVLAYVKGWVLGWRTVAWLCNIFVAVPCLLLIFIPESAAWLISKGRTDEALKSLNWFNKYQPQPLNKAQSLAEMQLDQLQKEHLRKMEIAARTGGGIGTKLKHFTKPTGYKPFLILVGLFFFQQFSGIYITLFYSIKFFEEVGSNIDPYVSSIMLGTVRCLMSIVNTYMLRTYRRRPLICWSAFGMAVCMTVSGLFTFWIKQGSTTMTWVPVACIGMYVVTSMIGLLSIPWTMMAELFPIEIRGLAHSIVNAIASILMFWAVQSYNFLGDTFGGAAGIQWFFAVLSLCGLVYSVIFLPETHGLKLSEIGEYFEHNIIFLGQKKRPMRPKKFTIPTRATTKDIIIAEEDTNEALLDGK